MATVGSAAAADPTTSHTALLEDLRIGYENLWQGSTLVTSDVHLEPGEVGRVRVELCGPSSTSCGVPSSDEDFQSVRTGGVVKARLVATDDTVWVSSPSIGEQQRMIYRNESIEWTWPVKSDEPGVHDLDFSVSVLYADTEIALATYTARIRVIVSSPGPLGVAHRAWNWLTTSALVLAVLSIAVSTILNYMMPPGRRGKKARKQRTMEPESS